MRKLLLLACLLPLALPVANAATRTTSQRLNAHPPKHQTLRVSPGQKRQAQTERVVSKRL